MTKEKLIEAKRLEENIKFKLSLLESLNNGGFWNVSITMDGNSKVWLRGHDGNGMYDTSDFFQDLTIDFIKKLKARTEHSIRKNRTKLKNL